MHRYIPVGVGVLDDPSGKFDLDGQIFPHIGLPPLAAGDVEDAVPYNPISGDFMYFLMTAAQRKARGGSLYLEFQPGPYRNEHWQDDSLYLPAPLFDDLGLYDLFHKAIPHFDYYDYTEVTPEQFRLLAQLAQDHHTQCAAEILAELIPHAEKWLTQQGYFTICGI